MKWTQRREVILKGWYTLVYLFTKSSLFQRTGYTFSGDIELHFAVEKMGHESSTIWFNQSLQLGSQCKLLETWSSPWRDTLHDEEKSGVPSKIDVYFISIETRRSVHRLRTCYYWMSQVGVCLLEMDKLKLHGTCWTHWESENEDCLRSAFQWRRSSPIITVYFSRGVRVCVWSCNTFYCGLLYCFHVRVQTMCGKDWMFIKNTQEKLCV